MSTHSHELRQIAGLLGQQVDAGDEKSVAALLGRVGPALRAANERLSREEASAKKARQERRAVEEAFGKARDQLRVARVQQAAERYCRANEAEIYPGATPGLVAAAIREHAGCRWVLSPDGADKDQIVLVDQGGNVQKDATQISPLEFGSWVEHRLRRSDPYLFADSDDQEPSGGTGKSYADMTEAELREACHREAGLR